MNFSDYSRLEALNHSGMKYLERSPAHYKAWRDGTLDDKTTDAQSFGISAHVAILEPDRFETDYLFLPDTSHCKTPAEKAALTKASKKEFAGENKRLLSYADNTAILSMREAVMKHAYARYLIESSLKEKVNTWTDPDSGAACKARFDLWRPESGILSNIKTIQDASNDAFARHVRSYNMARQAAFYTDGVQAESFLWIVIEHQEPYGVRVITVPDYLLQIGRQSYQLLSHLYQRCIETDTWPSYSQEVTPLWLNSTTSVAESASI